MDQSLDILVVDDDEDIRNILATIIVSEYPSYSVIPAQSVEEATELLLDYDFSIAYLDQMLPGREGLALGENLRKNYPHMKIAIITAAPSKELREQARSLDLTFIPKPFRKEQILAVVKEYHQERLEQKLPEDYHPDFASAAGDFSPRLLPQRESNQKRLVQRIKDDLFYLSKQYDLDRRMDALRLLITAQAFEFELPQQKGQTLYELYDSLMERYGKKKEFS